MDPITQGTLGAALPQATRHRTLVGIAGALGFLGGVAADLDVVIRSSSDPLLFLEYHRQFTHALVFIPIGGLAVAIVMHLILGHRWKLDFWQTALFCTLGYATHALLDTATSYGTMLLWPFSDTRFALRIISVIDPLFSVPLACLVAAAWLTKRSLYARLGLLWAGLYLALGAVQHHSALTMGRELAAGRGHQPLRLEVKPSFGNIVVWQVLYETEDRFYLDAVRAGIAPTIYPGESVPKLDLARDLPWLEPGTQQARDVERFRRFSTGYVAPHPSEPNRLIDVRFTMVPNKAAALWSIELRETAGPADHVGFRAHRASPSESVGRLWNMITGNATGVVR